MHKTKVNRMILDTLLNTGKKKKGKRNSCKLPRNVIQITLKISFPNQARKVIIEKKKLKKNMFELKYWLWPNL